MKLDASEASLTDLDREALAWVELVQAGSPSGHQIGALKEWRGRTPAHEEAYVLALSLWRTVGMYPKGSADHYRATWYNRSSTRRNILSGIFIISGGGYCLAKPPLGLWPSLAELSADYRTQIGERRKVELTEGLNLDLNARTSISVRNDRDGPGIELVEGEVMVTAQLARDGMVHVSAGAGRVIAQTACLDILNEGGLVRVTCVSGAAAVENGTSHVSLRAGQQLRYSGDVLSAPTRVDATIVTAWRQGLMVFHKTRLEQVVAEVNRYRAGKIVLMDRKLADQRFSGTVRIDRVQEIVGLIQKSTSASAVHLGNLVLLS